MADEAPEPTVGSPRRMDGGGGIVPNQVIDVSWEARGDKGGYSGPGISLGSTDIGSGIEFSEGAGISGLGQRTNLQAKQYIYWKTGVWPTTPDEKELPVAAEQEILASQAVADLAAQVRTTPVYLCP